MKNQDNDTYSLAHTRWKCQYHLVFTPKYHRRIIYEELRAEIGKILRELCKRKEVKIIEAHAMPNHIHSVTYQWKKNGGITNYKKWKETEQIYNESWGGSKIKRGTKRTDMNTTVWTERRNTASKGRAKRRAKEKWTKWLWYMEAELRWHTTRTTARKNWRIWAYRGYNEI